MAHRSAALTTARGRGRAVAIALAAVWALSTPSAQAQPVVDFEVVKDGIPKPLTATPGSAQRGKTLLAKREAATCLNCHSTKDLRGGGSAPALDGVGAVLTPPQLRLSVADYARVAPGKAMPSFHTARDHGAPRLSAQEIEDIVAYLGTLRQ